VKQFMSRGARCAPLLLALFAFPPAAHPQTASQPDTTPLSFRGIPAGASLSSLAATLRTLGGRPVRCTRSSSDRSVQECRGSFVDSATGLGVDLWLSAIDSQVGIITFKAEGNLPRLDLWKAELERRYGKVSTRVQGQQRMMQWVRRGRMIRLTWKREGAGSTMSLSLVDGRVLDGWGRRPRQR
jgi:hypothetical protein